MANNNLRCAHCNDTVTVHRTLVLHDSGGCHGAPIVVGDGLTSGERLAEAATVWCGRPGPAKVHAFASGWSPASWKVVARADPSLTDAEVNVTNINEALYILKARIRA